MSQDNNRIILYTSNFCSHAWAVERFLEQHEVPTDVVNINEDVAARRRVVELNNGYASVPTLVFPDGSYLTEPSFGQLKHKLGIESPGLVQRIKDALGGTE